LFPTVPPNSGSRPFGDELAARVASRESQIVLGLDPDPQALWPAARVSAAEASAAGASAGRASAAGASAAQTPTGGSPRQRVAAAVLAHCRLVIDAVAPACVAVKPQLARFELLGSDGWAALEATVAHAQERGLLVIADGKRGDIDITARSYAQALMGSTETPLGALDGLGADLATVNPLMGGDGVDPFVEVARDNGAGVLVLVRTSNPGAADVEDLELAGGGRVWERLASLVGKLCSQNVGESGIGDVGAVVGATAPEHIARARELMPSSVFLLPGVGAQGGRVEDLAPAFEPGRAGGLVSASRSIVNAHLAETAGDPALAARAEAERLRRLAWDLA
jgi:orotidine-5'-phosphate decarboxylase